MTQYSLAFAPLGKTFVVNMETSKVITLGDTQLAKPKVKLEDMPEEVKSVPTSSADPRITFIDDVLKPGDTVWTLLGGPNSGFVQRAFGKGVNVFRVPHLRLEDSFLVTPHEDEATVEDEDEEDQGVKVNGLEAKRKATALALATLAQTAPEYFYPMRAIDAKVAEISVLVRAFAFWQKDLRIKAQQQIKGLNRDFAYLADDQLTKKQLDLKRRFASDDLLKETVGMEADLLKMLTQALDGLSLYNTVFLPIKGCGPSISGQIIDVVQDIRRFPSRSKFRKYSGWFPNGPEGQIICRQRGQTMGISTRAKQAFNLFGDQVANWGSGPDFIREVFVGCKAAEIAKGGTKLLAHRRAKRKAIGRFVDFVFFHWWVYEITGGTMTHLTVPQSEIPYAVRKDLITRFPELGITMT